MNSTYPPQEVVSLRRRMSHFGRFEVTGADAATLLHHLTTNDIKGLAVGGVCEAVLVNNKARILDWLTVYRREPHRFLVITSPNRRSMFQAHCEKFVLFRQDVAIRDVTATTSMEGAFWRGPASADVPSLSGVSFATLRLPGHGVIRVFDDPDENAIEGADFCEDARYNCLRIESGIPVTGTELTEDFNPWEARLDFAISLHKGCYNGQEVVARLNTYQKVKRKLTAFNLSGTPATPAVIKRGEKTVGVLTSSANSLQFGCIGLGYLRESNDSGCLTLGDEKSAITEIEWPRLAEEKPL